MPFLPKIYYYFNCFRKYRPPTRVWETVSRAEWSSSADAADNPLFAHMPYLWNLRPEHHRIWANPKQTQTIQWPRVPPNGMACKVITNDQFLLSCLPQYSQHENFQRENKLEKNHLPETVLLLQLLVARWENTMPLKDRDGPKLHPENA